MPHPNTLGALPGRHPLRGLLPLVQLAWLAVMALALVLVIDALPGAYERHRAVCVTTACPEGQLRPDDVTALAGLRLTIQDYAAARVALAALSALVFVGAGVIMVALRRDEPMALLVSAMLICIGAAIFAGDQGSLAARIVGAVGWGSWIGVFFLFPSGRFVPRWTRWAAPALLAGELIYYFAPQSQQAGGLFGLLGFLAWIGMLTLGPGAQIYRYRRAATPVERQQTKVVIFGIALIVAVNAVAVLVGWLGGSPPVFGLSYDLIVLPLMANVILCALPVTMALAVLRRGLWAVDPLIRRTLVYAALTTLVALIYVAMVSYLGLLFRASGSPGVAIVATVMVAVLFQPLRERVQRLVNRLLYGERDDPNTVLARLGARLEATLAPEAVLPTIIETLAQALRLPYAAVLLDDEAVAVHPPARPAPDAAELLRLPLVYQGQRLGELLVAPRSAGEPWSPADRRLLETTAGHAGVAVHGVRLMAELRSLNSELQRSRERLVLAREEERRQLRGDLHDELAPTLAALAMAAGKASRLVARDPEAAVRQMEALREELRAQVGDIRRLAHNLRPPALDELGLLGAVRARAAHYDDSEGGPVVRVKVEEPLPVLPAAVEVAAYRIVQEALANVAKHSGAGRCTISVRAAGGWLELEVADDGAGVGSDATQGVGLRSMRERATELGGSLSLGPRRGGGTLLHVRLPFQRQDDRGQE